MADRMASDVVPLRWYRYARWLIAVLAVYFVVAYVVMPLGWRRYARRHPAIDALRGVTETASRIPGDPIDLALAGTESEVIGAMLAADWHAADGLSLKSSLGIAFATVLRRPYEDAPVSSLYLWGRKQDLAFEQPIGSDPRKRHHVRYWKSERLDADGRPLWAGSVTLDERVGLSHTTGQITHHIDGNVDAERDRLMEQLQKTGWVERVEIVDGFHQIRSGRNGGGDPWYTDGRLFVGYLRLPGSATASPPAAAGQ